MFGLVTQTILKHVESKNEKITALWLRHAAQIPIQIHSI